MKKLKTGFKVRGDCLYCPLSFSLDTYGNCLTDCHHCYLRKLNHTWGKELKPLDTDKAIGQLERGAASTRPVSDLAHCLAQRKTLRLGNKTDPFQDAEREHRCSRTMMEALNDMEWNYVLQTRHTETMMEYEELILEGNVIVMPVISPGWNRDWTILERGRTTRPKDRLKHSKRLIKQGVQVGINGEPFIPGFHTVEEFEKMLKRLKDYGINRYNTYNFHFNDYVAKRLVKLDIDIEKIWWHNQDEPWRKILVQLLALAIKHDIILGCPDFVNTGMEWRERANTCCGVEVDNPVTFNTHHWKQRIQGGQGTEEIIRETYEGIGDYDQGVKILNGTSDKFYCLSDVPEGLIF
jgi:DNA repair photolyase